MVDMNLLNCWKLLRAIIATAQLETANATALRNMMDWTISSEAPMTVGDGQRENVQRLTGRAV